jgi:hypothetical protein
MVKDNRNPPPIIFDHRPRGRDRATAGHAPMLKDNRVTLTLSARASRQVAVGAPQLAGHGGAPTPVGLDGVLSR